MPMPTNRFDRMAFSGRADRDEDGHVDEQMTFGAGCDASRELIEQAERAYRNYSGMSQQKREIEAHLEAARMMIRWLERQL